MKKCLNCNIDNRDTDSYCRSCGCPLQTNRNYTFINVLIIFVIIGIVFMAALFVSSYLVN